VGTRWRRREAAAAGLGVLLLLGTTAASAAGTSPTGTWTSVAPLLVAHTGMNATLLRDSRVLAVGDGDTLVDTEIYDPASNTWTRTGDLEQVRNYYRRPSWSAAAWQLPRPWPGDGVG
jgi:hypothetical protein